MTIGTVKHKIVKYFDEPTYLIDASENTIIKKVIIKIKKLYFLKFIVFFALIIKKPHNKVINGKNIGL